MSRIVRQPRQTDQAGIVLASSGDHHQIATGDRRRGQHWRADRSAADGIRARLRASADPAAAPATFACAFSPSYAPIGATGGQRRTAGGGVFNPLIYFGATNAVFFMMFGAGRRG